MRREPAVWIPRPSTIPSFIRRRNPAAFPRCTTASVGFSVDQSGDGSLIDSNDGMCYYLTVKEHSLQIESQEKNEKKWKNFSQGIVCTANRPPRSAGLCRKREAVRNQIRPPRPLRPPLVKGKRSPSRSRCAGICLLLNSH